ncbi:MAG: hypothetical protein ACK41P_10150 [Asticcacaulis sp.]
MPSTDRAESPTPLSSVPTPISASPDRQKRLLLCAISPMPDDHYNLIPKVFAQIEAMACDHLTPCLAPARWRDAPTYVRAALDEKGPFDGVLMVGHTRQTGPFRVEMRAQNLVNAKKADETGFCWPGEKIQPVGPAFARTTAPVMALVNAVQAIGLPCVASSDAGRFLSNFMLYALLTGDDGLASDLPVGCLRAPRSLEGHNGQASGILAADAMMQAIMTAARAFDQALSARAIANL